MTAGYSPDTNFNINPFTESELLEAFVNPDLATSKHLLILYSLVVGLGAKQVLDLGIGTTTRALRAAALKTGAVVFSCDRDPRFTTMSSLQDDHWKLLLGPSETSLKSLPGPFDFVMHDAAHDYFQVKLDLQLILPKVKKFGMICVHDTQQTDLSSDMLAAIRDAVVGHKVSLTTLPFNAGLTIIRIEDSSHPAIKPSVCRGR
jgi:predicted O-methyltransferase YrrM